LSAINGVIVGTSSGFWPRAPGAPPGQRTIGSPAFASAIVEYDTSIKKTIAGNAKAKDFDSFIFIGSAQAVSGQTHRKSNVDSNSLLLYLELRRRTFGPGSMKNH